MIQAILFAAAPLIALTNPIAELPLFLSIIAGRSPREARGAALRVAVAVWTILVVSAIAGLQILELLGISLASFRAAGGLLLVVMGLEMLQGREPSSIVTMRDPDDAEDALWVPLIMPMLAGPGSIVIAMSLTAREALVLGWVPVATIGGITIASLVVLASLLLAGTLGRYIHGRGTRILTRFSGMILVAIGFQMGFTGIQEFFSL